MGWPAGMRKNGNVAVLDPITKTIEVPCSREKAFGVFVNEMESWWPLAKRSMSAHDGAIPKSLSIEAKHGGKIVEIGHDDKVHLWGTITSYDPHDSIVMDFHMGLPRGETASLVEVRFSALGKDRTRVELTQSNWEAYGELAEMMRNGYGSGWVIIFEQAYKSACGG